jgi:hypothetical protein
MRRQLVLTVIPILLAILINAAATVSAGCQIDSDDWPAGVVRRDELSQDRSFSYDFTNISVRTLQTWLARIRVELPVELDGDLAGWVWVQRSPDKWFDFSNYRLEGEIRSPELKIDKWSVGDAEVRFGFAEGNWYIGKLSGEIQAPDDQSRIGLASANAKILTAATKTFELGIQIDQIDLKSLLKSFQIDLAIKNTGGSVKLSAEAPIANASDLTKWNATTALRIDEVELPWVESPSRAFATVNLVDGAWKLDKGQLTVAGQDLTLAGEGRLEAEFPFELSLSGRNIELSQLLQQLKNDELAAQLAGAIKLDAQATGSQSKGVESAMAVFQSDRLLVNSQAVSEIAARIGYTPAGIRLDLDSAAVSRGILKGSAAWRDVQQLSQGIPSAASIEISGLDLEQIAWLNLPVKVRGQATGKIDFETQPRDVGVDWSSKGRLQIDGLEAAGTGFGETRLEWNKEFLADKLAGTFSVSQGSGSLEGKVTATLADDPGTRLLGTKLVQYRAEGQLRDYDVLARYGSEPTSEIPVRANGDFDVTGSPANWLERGTVQFSNSAAKVGERLLRMEMADLSFTAEEFRLERFRLLDPIGRIAGAASIRRNNLGEHLLRLRVIDVDLRPYVEAFGPETLRSLDGKLSIEMELRNDAASKSLIENWNGQWQGSLTGLMFQGQPVGDLDLRGSLVDQILSATATGQLLGGEAQATLRFPLAIVSNEPTTNSDPANLQVQLVNLQIERLARLVWKPNVAQQTGGTVALKLSAIGHTLQDVAITTQIEMPKLMYRQEVLARNLDAQIGFTGNTLQVENLSGGFAGGRIDARGQLQLDAGLANPVSTGKISFAARRIDAGSIMGLLGPEYSEYFSGVINYQGTATFHRGVQTRGVAVLEKAILFGLPIQIARGDVQTELGPDFEFRELVCNDLHGTAIGGSFVAELAIKGGTRISLNTNGRVTRGKLEQLSQALGFQQIVGSGTFDGRFALQSPQIESISAISGGLRIDFESGDVQSIPVISSLSRFVPLAQFASTDIESGRLDAMLGQGQLRIIDLLLTSKAFWLAASGSASLSATKLDIDAVVQTGGGVQQRATKYLIDLALVGPLPQVAVLNELNELVRNRSVFLHVGGSPSQPVIQTKTGQTAAKAFLQNFGRAQLGVTPVVDD